MDGSGALVIVGIAAFLLPPVASWLRAPAVVVEILFGVLVGPVFGLVQGTELLDQIGTLGLLMLMFLAGFEIDFPALRRGGAGPIGQALVVFTGTFALSFLATVWLELPVFYAPLLATTSAALVLPSLRSAGITTESLGQAILVSAVIADLVTLLLVAEITIWARDGWGIELINGPLLLVAVVVVLRVMKLVLWWHPLRVSRLFQKDDPDEMGIRGALALLLIFVGLSTVLDVEPILAAFLAGGVFALLFQPPEGLRHQLSGISWGFLIPIFFINVGLRFEVAALLNPEALARAGSSSAWRSSSSSCRPCSSCSGFLAQGGGGYRIPALSPTEPRDRRRHRGPRTRASRRNGPGDRGDDRRSHLAHLPGLFRSVITHGSARRPGDLSSAPPPGTR